MKLKRIFIALLLLILPCPELQAEPAGTQKYLTISEIQMLGPDYSRSYFSRISGLSLDDKVPASRLEELVRKTTAKLRRKNLFSEVEIEALRSGEDLKLQVRLLPEQVVKEVQIVSFGGVPREEVRRASRVRVGSAVSALELEKAKQKIRELHLKYGFREAEISAYLLSKGEPGWKSLVFNIEEGYRSEIAAVRFLGETPEELSPVLREFGEEATGKFATEETVSELSEELLYKIRSQGYLGASLQPAELGYY